MTIRMVAMATGAMLAVVAPPTAQARGHGLHGHRGFGVHHSRVHCHTYKDQYGHRDPVCV